MIISHQHKFIFIKTAKTAGTSVEIALAQICGDRDVITPLTGSQEKSRPGRGAQNLDLDHPLKPRRPLLKRLLRRPERSWHPSVGYYSHMPAWRVRGYVGEQTWKEYFTFAFERNPWDRQVSHYHYKYRKHPKKPDFSEYLSRKKRAYVDNYDLYSFNDEIIVDFVGCYEHLAEDFRYALERIGVGEELSLGVVNSTPGRQADYRPYFRKQTRARLEKWYSREIRSFSYRFDDIGSGAHYRSK